MHTYTHILENLLSKPGHKMFATIGFITTMNQLSVPKITLELNLDRARNTCNPKNCEGFLTFTTGTVT